MKEVKIDSEFIKLGQLLKLTGVATSGVEAKYMILEGNVKLNKVVVLERGKKIHHGDIVEVEGVEYKVLNS